MKKVRVLSFFSPPFPAIGLKYGTFLRSVDNNKYRNMKQFTHPQIYTWFSI